MADIYEQILNDPYDIAPKWQPVSPCILDEHVISVSDMYFYYCHELSKLDYQHRNAIYKNYHIYKELKKKTQELEKQLRDLEYYKKFLLKNKN